MNKETYQKEFTKYEGHYSEDGLKSKLSKYAKLIGLNATYYVLLLYNMLTSGVLSIKEQALIWGALGYFISPIDLLPDVLIGTGFMDDVSVLLIVIKMLFDSIDTDKLSQIKEAAKKQLKKFFYFREEDLDSKYR